MFRETCNTFFSLISLFQTVNGDVSGAIGQLEKNDIATAKEVIKILDQISLEKSNPENKLAASLSREIKRTFLAEFNLLQATLKFNAEAEKADILDQQARENLKPNALGYINQIGADAKLKTARETRVDALKLTTKLSAELDTALNSLCKQAENAELSRWNQAILKKTADSIRSRTLKPAGKLGPEMVQRVESETIKIAAEDATRAENIELQAAASNRASALRAMQRAMRTGSRTDEARAMKLLMSDAPDAVDGFNDYLAAKAAKAAASRQADLENRISELESRTR